eukprot:gb/GEZN01005494.1/.p1 GENE.gb/GEZN01005494.1/~~gb/GEZN01005494.1/.p1  ORF type:complete len:378 (-),score=101.72 gb/GEZN01005494.1/:530-1663(-)
MSDDEEEDEEERAAMALSMAQQRAPTQLKLRVRAPTGQTWNLQLLSTDTILKLKQTIQEKSLMPVARQKLLSGYPPSPLLGDLSLSLESTNLRTGETLLLQEATEPAATSSSPLSTHSSSSTVCITSSSSPVAPARPLSSSSSSSSSSPSPSPAMSASAAGAPSKGAEISSRGKQILRRVIPDDNSCLFNAVGYVLDRGNTQMSSFLRQVVASVVLLEHAKFEGGLLEGGRSPEAYAQYIMDPQKWGGAVELQILADYYNAEIAAADIQSKNLYIYGQGKGYMKRVYLAYSGIHYDALVTSPNPQDDSKDRTIFLPDDTQTEQAVRQFARESHEKKMFTNVQRFALRCEDCGQGLVGSGEAAQHAKQTGHRSFSEYK